MEIDRRMPAYPMRVVQQLTGLSGRQIRYYDQMGLVQPRRTMGRQRLYSERDVERLRLVKELFEKGLTVSGIRAYLREQEAKAAATTGRPIDRTIATQNESPTGGPLVRRLTSVYPVSNQAELYDVVDRPTATARPAVPARDARSAPAPSGPSPQKREEQSRSESRKARPQTPGGGAPSDR